MSGALAALEGREKVVRGEFRPDGLEREWCDADVLRMLRRRSLAALRREVEPVDAATLGRFLPEWQAATRPRSGPPALLETIGQLQGAAIPASILETDVLPSRIRGFRPADLDALCASGDVVWVGAGGIGADDGRIALGFRDDLAARHPAVGRRRSSAGRAAVPSRGAGASFWPELYASAGIPDGVSSSTRCGTSSGPARSRTTPRAAPRVPRAAPPQGRRQGGKPRPGALRQAGPPAAAGRWSLAASVLRPEPTPTESAHARAMHCSNATGS